MSSLQRPPAASAQAPPVSLSAEQAKVVLAEVIKAFGSPENAQRLEEARDNACNDMGKMLQFLLPVATQIQQDVIKAYGFSNDGEVKKISSKRGRRCPKVCQIDKIIRVSGS
ncbi:protein C10 isoform X2 [Crotalus tigris]|uniref:protein C10 isoform X2 n=1 Tax=Crotalus tigris TaxID=88082 RepID=UPI00192F2232|nr:protein C10 isoform X2 [Crotalus tigris]